MAEQCTHAEIFSFVLWTHHHSSSTFCTILHITQDYYAPSLRLLYVMATAGLSDLSAGVYVTSVLPCITPVWLVSLHVLCLLVCTH